MRKVMQSNDEAFVELRNFLFRSSTRVFISKPSPAASALCVVPTQVLTGLVADATNYHVTLLTEPVIAGSVF